MKKYFLIFSTLLFMSSCIDANMTSKKSHTEQTQVVARKFSFNGYMNDFINSREYYNNNEQTRSNVSNELRDSLMLLKGDTLYNVLLKFKDLGPTVDSLRGVRFNYSYRLPNYNSIKGRFYGVLPVSELDNLVEGNEYYITCIFNGFTEDARVKDKLYMTPKVRYNGEVDLGVLPIEIIEITEKQRAAK